MTRFRIQTRSLGSHSIKQYCSPAHLPQDTNLHPTPVWPTSHTTPFKSWFLSPPIARLTHVFATQPLRRSPSIKDVKDETINAKIISICSNYDVSPHTSPSISLLRATKETRSNLSKPLGILRKSVRDNIIHTYKMCYIAAYDDARSK